MKEYKLTGGSSVMLDLIRGISAQLVVIGHGMSFFSVFAILGLPVIPWLQNGGVLVFFLLSGFLISQSTLNKKLLNKNYSFKFYFIDRFTRIYVAFIPAILFVLLIDLISISIDSSTYKYFSAFNVQTFVGNLLMLQDYPVFSSLSQEYMTSFGSARPFWTLAIEWWIYLFFGYLILVFCRQDKISWSRSLILCFLSIVPLYNLIQGRGEGMTLYWIFGSVIYLITSLNIIKSVNRRIKIFFTIALLALALGRLLLKLNIYDVVLAFILGLILFLLIDIFSDISFSLTSTRIIHFVASYSYTLYLIHYSILDFVQSHFSKTEPSLLFFILAFILSNIISIGIGRYTEVSLTPKIKSFLYKATN